MFGSDNVCYRNENKGLSYSKNRIESTELQVPCAGESSDIGGFARNCRMCAAPFNTFDGRRRFCSDECRDAATSASLRRRQAAHRQTEPDSNRARQILKNAVMRGMVRRCARCEACGKVEKTEGHHTDYSRPLFVTWLCRACHAGLEDGQHFGCGRVKHPAQSALPQPALATPEMREARQW